MAELKEARVPDIGGHSDVPVIELLVKTGDTVAKDESVLIMESMKMELEVKCKAAGVITYKIDSGATVAAGQTLAIVC